MAEIPVAVREFLTSKDSMFRVSVVQRHPDLQQLLESPETRAALMEWLGSEEAWEPKSSIFTANVLEFLQASAAVEDAPVVKPFVLHPYAQVRRTAYEFLLALYYPDKNREAMFLLLSGMLSDADDQVRLVAASFIKGVGVVDELRSFLERWQKTAAAAGWEKTQSYEQIGRLLKL
jgi:hypothetical protein